MPLTETELDKMADELKLIVMPEITFITEVDGEPAAVALALPNLNEAIRDLTASSSRSACSSCSGASRSNVPRRRASSSSGIRKKYRQMKKYAGLSTYLYVQMNNTAGAPASSGASSPGRSRTTTR